MPTIKTWTGFSKRRNSTKQPSATGTVVDVKLKEDTSIESPVFILQGDQFNIDYVQAFGAYYFVSNIISLANGLTELHCEKDVMATYKSEIGSTSAYIMYARGGNNDIIDKRLSMEATPIIKTAYAPFPWTIQPTGGRYLLTVNGLNGVATYNMDEGQLNDLMQQTAVDKYLNTILDAIQPSPSTPPTVADVLEGILWVGTWQLKAFKLFMAYRNIPDSIISCIWVPINYTVSNSQQIYLGSFPTGVSADLMSNTNSVPASINITIPWEFNDWRDCAPYTELYLYIPFVGVLHYDPSSFRGQTYISLQFSLARCNGDCSVEVYSGNVKLGTYAVNLKGNYPLGTMVSNPVQQITSVVGAAGGLAAGVATLNPLGIAGAAAGGAASVGSAFTPTPMTVGGLGGGSGAGLDDQIRVWLVCHDTSEAPGASNATLGKPVMATGTIGSYSGYIQTSGASVSIPGESVDRDAINSFLNGGFFYE